MATSDRRFPVLKSQRDHDEAIAAAGLRTVPWTLLAPHEEWAWRNHDQSLERLAERGGLGVCEMLSVIEHRRWHAMDFADAVAQLKALVAAHEGKP